MNNERGHGPKKWRPFPASVVLLLAGLPACLTDVPGSADAPRYLISALTTFRGPYTEVGGNIVVADGWVASAGENGGPPVLVIWPKGQIIRK